MTARLFCTLSLVITREAFVSKTNRTSSPPELATMSAGFSRLTQISRTSRRQRQRQHQNDNEQRPLTMTITIPLWLDCDPGHDDTIALLISCFHETYNLVGVSTTYGNAPLDDTTHNALAMLTVFQKTCVPVYAGSARPLNKDPFYAPGIHGSNGLGGIEIPTPSFGTRNTFGDEDSMLDAMYQAACCHEGQLALVAVGPLTNVAKLLMKYPDVATKLKVLSIMGGGVKVFNLPSQSEFNIFNDPHAANLIFGCKELQGKTILCPLDVTHTVICDTTIQSKILNKPNTTTFRQMVYDLMTFFAKQYKDRQQFSQGPPIHDQVAVFVLLDVYDVMPIGLVTKTLSITVVESGDHEGKLISHEGANSLTGIHVAFKVDVRTFWEDALDVIALADAAINSS